MRILKIHTLLLCAILVLVSCERKTLYDYDTYVGSNSLPVPIDIDWATSGIDLQNVTVLFYNSEDGTLKYEHTYEHNSSDVQSYAYLPEGNYTAVIFNELRNQIDYLSCVGYENISTLKFESNDNEPARSRSTTRGYVEQPGDLAVAVVENIDVTEDMIEEVSKIMSTKSLSDATKSTRSSLTGVTAVKKTATINISAHFNNIYYARMPALVDLNNLADGYYVYGDQNSTTPSTIQFTMNNRTYDEGSSYDGTISVSISTFGTLGDRTSTSGHDETTPITLDILFQLIDADATEVSYIEDITDNILFDDMSSSIYLDIDIKFPEALPEVVPDGSGGDSGFSSSVEEWIEQQVLL